MLLVEIRGKGRCTIAIINLPRPASGSDAAADR